MQRCAKRKANGNTFRIDNLNEILVIYTTKSNSFSIFELSTYKCINIITLEEIIINISISYPSIVITTRSHIITRNIYTGSQDLCVFIQNCINSYLLSNKKLIAVYENKFYVYNMHNQEESKYNYEILKVIDDKVLFYHNRIIHILENNNIKIIKRILEPIENNFDFCYNRNKITIINGNDIYNDNYRLVLTYFDKFVDDFKICGDYIYIGIDKKLYVYDRKENANTNLRKFSFNHNFSESIKPINLCKQWSREYIIYDDFEVLGKYLIVLYNSSLYSYKKIENDINSYVICDVSYDYKEAECEFDISNESDLD